MSIIWKDVFSSNVAKLGFDPERNLLYVSWVKGRTSEYEGVDEKLFDELTKAPSVGSAIHDRVKGKYGHRYVEV